MHPKKIKKKNQKKNPVIIDYHGVVGIEKQERIVYGQYNIQFLHNIKANSG
jgi:hypothetical protein